MTSTSSAADTGLPADYIDPFMLPEVYGLEVTGDTMAPDHPDGTAAAFSKSVPYEQGDVVAVWFRPGVLKVDGKPMQCLLKRIVMMPMPGTTFPYREHPDSEVSALVMLGSDDKPDMMLPIRCKHILAIHKCIGQMPDYVSRRRRTVQ